MTAPILYCGDTSFETDAAYLAAMLTVGQFGFDYCPSDRDLQAEEIRGRRLVILSDYPSARMAPHVQRELVSAVAGGTSLLMVGGWESYHGLGGDWDTTAVAAALPVIIQNQDDRLNCDHPVVIRQMMPHPIADGLPWTDRVPVVGGFNRFQARPDATVILEADRLRPRYVAGQWQMTVIETHPMLVVGQHGKGRTAAVATDGAPHWVGGFVDWGEQRVTGQAPGSRLVEVGHLYAGFWKQLFGWLTGL